MRTSRFGRKLNIKGQNIKLDSNIFNKKYVENFVKKSNIRITLASDSATQNLINDYEANKLPNAPTRIVLISLASKIRHHDKSVSRALSTVDGAIVVELPIFDPKTHILTGHIDLLIQEKDGHLVVWDYKPPWDSTKWSPELDAPIGSSFIQYLPQVASYALILMDQLGLKGVTGGIYNQGGTWEFDPATVMRNLNSDFPNALFPWRKFNILNLN